MCPIMGLKSAVMVVAGWETWQEGDADGSTEISEVSAGG